MQRIILSLALIVFAGGVVVFGVTKAFFSDTESSSGNVFTAGAVDLLVDNTSYYNGLFNSGTSWESTNLTTHKFFDFDDVKPGDYGEDTISLTVETNDAYLCANVRLTSNGENGCTEPESEVDQTCGAPGNGQGELAKLVEFMWWADDGDNVLEDDETVISKGTLGQLSVGASYPLTLADSTQNIWNAGNAPGPVPGNTTKYIGKAWCFGTINPARLPQDNIATSRTPAKDNNGDGQVGTPADGGFSCSGMALGNESQTDSLTADISFSAVQARHHPTFECEKQCRIVEEEVHVIANSNFESPVVSTSALWDITPSPVNGWVIEWRSDVPATFGSQTRPAIANLELHRGVLGSAYEGDQYAELDSDWGGPSSSGTGEPASVSMYQDITTVPGRPYRITFAFAARPNTSASENRVEVRWGSAVVYDTEFVADNNAGIEWQPISIDVEATAPITRLQFTDLGTANSVGSFIDAVKLYRPVCQ